MTDYDDLNTYNDDSVHDMWVDFDNYPNICALEVLIEGNLNKYIDKLNTWN